MAVEKIYEIIPAPSIREDAYWVTYKETEPPPYDEYDGMCTVPVTCRDWYDENGNTVENPPMGDEMTVRRIFLREYHQKWEVEWETSPDNPKNQVK